MYIIPNGTNVIVRKDNNPLEYMRGVIVGAEEEDNEEWLIVYYQVLCEDCNIYTCMHMNSYYDYPYFRTYDEELTLIDNDIVKIHIQMDNLKNRISELTNLRNKLEEDKIKLTLKK